MAHGTPRDHHYVPQFYLRGFASDPAKVKIKTVARNGDYAVFSERAIRTVGVERDFYIHMRRGVPINVETVINASAESPLSSSDTWRKISSGLSHQLDRGDKGVIYSLIRHLEGRSPHARQISMELAQMAADPNSDIPFTDAERQMYTTLRRNRDEFRRLMNFRSISMPWTEHDFHRSYVAIWRSPIPLRSSSVPVMCLTAPEHPAFHLPLPGQTPFIYALSLDRATLAMLAFGEFDNGFETGEMHLDAALMFNRHYAGYFAKFAHIRHLIADDDQLATDMTWAPFDLLESKRDHMKFKRRPKS